MNRCPHPESSRWGKPQRVAGGAWVVPVRCNYCGKVNPPARSRLADLPVYGV